MPIRSTVLVGVLVLLGTGLIPGQSAVAQGNQPRRGDQAGDGGSLAVTGQPYRPGWRLRHTENFARPLDVDSAPWVRDPHGEQSPWNVDDLDDDGKFFDVMGGADFRRHLDSFDVLRKRVPVGRGGWLTAELAARDKDKDGKPEAPPSVRNVRLKDGPAALIDEPSHDTGVILRSTQPLPAQYRIEATLKSVDFGGQRDGRWNYRDKINGYRPDGCKTNFPWKRRLDFTGPSEQCNPRFNDVRVANGYYFLSIMDYPNPAPHNNIFIHTHRKVGMDGYNVSDPSEGEAYAVCDPSTGKTHNYNQSTGNGVNAIFFAGERYQNPFIGYNAFDMPTPCGTFDQTQPENHIIVSAAEIRPELMPRHDYTFAIERLEHGYVMEMTGVFRNLGHRTLRYYRPFVSPDGKAAIWHYNNTPAQYDGRFNTSLVYGDRTNPNHQYVHNDMWPAGSAYPDYFILGDPHLNYYEGTAAVTDLRLYTR